MLGRVLLVFTILSLYSFATTNNKIALLTFDDGPIKATKNIIETVREENIPVTMFFVGCQIENFPNIYKDAINYPNILIANHTYSHANNRYRKFYSDPLLVVEDIKKANSIVGVDNISNTSSAFLPVRLAGRNVFRLPTITKNDNMIDTIQREKEIVGYDDIYKITQTKPLPPECQQSLSGNVIDSHTKAALQGAKVTLFDNNYNNNLHVQLILFHLKYLNDCFDFCFEF